MAVTSFRLPPEVAEPLSEAARKIDVAPNRIVVAVMKELFCVQDPVAKMIAALKNQKMAKVFAARDEIDLHGAPPLSEADVRAMLYNYGTVGKATLEKYRAKVQHADGTYDEAKMVKLVRALAEAKWRDKTVAKSFNAIPPYRVIGKRLNHILVLSVVNNFDPPPGTEFIAQSASRYSWALCRCDCGHTFYHAVAKLSQAKCGGGKKPRDSMHYEPTLGYTCPLQPKRESVMVGQVFGELTVVEPSHLYGKFKCICRCGNVTHVARGSLTSGNTKSCGCWRKARMAGWKAPQPTSETSVSD